MGRMNQIYRYVHDLSNKRGYRKAFQFVYRGQDCKKKKKLVVSKNLQKPVLEKHIHYQASKLPRTYSNGDSHTQESASLY